jgi:hypothetical protein
MCGAASFGHSRAAVIVIGRAGPSVDTISAPSGVSGVQAPPNTLHCQGLITPFKTSPHWQALGSAIFSPGNENLRSAS